MSVSDILVYCLNIFNEQLRINIFLSDLIYRRFTVFIMESPYNLEYFANLPDCCPGILVQFEVFTQFIFVLVYLNFIE